MTRPVILRLLVATLLLATHSRLCAAESSLVEFTSGGRSYVGLSLARNLSTWLILSTDGQLHYLESDKNFGEVRLLQGEFIPASTMELRGSLVREFGSNFEVVATKHFLVVQPRGRGTKWPETFEQLHREFTNQLQRRGVNVRKGKFPMVAIVMPDRTSLHTELARQKLPTSNIAGIYISNSNRVYTHDSGNDSATLPVLRHEAAHQSAFNSNIHSRLNSTPKWITEGLGMLFEPPAMASGKPSTQAQRSHRDALAKLIVRYSDNQHSIASDVRRLIGEDNMFDNSQEVEAAYNASWLMQFYLSERRPAAFAKMLNFTASRPPFDEYAKAKRLTDFQAVVGLTPEALAAEMERFMGSLVSSAKK